MRRLIVAALLLAATGLALAAGRGGDGDAYRVRAQFDNALSVLPGMDVKVAGVRVGSVHAVDVDDDDPRRVDEQLPEGVERAGGERVDEEQSLRRGHLDEAEPRMVAVLADELGVETDLRTGGQVLAAGNEFLGGADDLFTRLL